ncbi:polysaccharide pyruvyl transferase family protein [Chthonobacter rhizosphaerae]|uniref:polysaccharide pyruvyl transferase family protein n=1 Tax=Chthonobacter rhizosphaerae TaxID=2735553 RepID=UPI0015EECC8B|nr:polysaccharide pyruvyl transferase family protein [Chthonobacter rhizosphaerae]
MKIALVHTTSDIGHHGCTLVNRRIEALAAAAGLEIVRRLPLFFDDAAADWRGIDAIVLNGEGSLHHDRKPARRIADLGRRFADIGLPAHLVNTIYEGNGPEVAEGVARFRSVTARDGASAASLRAAGIEAGMVPDLSLTWEPGPELAPRGTRVVIGDSVHRDVSADLWRYANSIQAPFFSMMTVPPVLVDYPDRNRRHRLRYVWRRASTALLPGGARRARTWAQFPTFERYVRFLADKAALVVTGRFHQLCIGLDMEIPVVAVSSNTRKLESLSADAGVEGRVVADVAAARALVAEKGLDGLAYTPDEIRRLRAFRADARQKAAALFAAIASG